MSICSSRPIVCQSSSSIWAWTLAARGSAALALKVSLYSLPSLRSSGVWKACTCQSEPPASVTVKTIAPSFDSIVPLPVSCCSQRQLSTLSVGLRRLPAFASAAFAGAGVAGAGVGAGALALSLATNFAGSALNLSRQLSQQKPTSLLSCAKVIVASTSSPETGHLALTGFAAGAGVAGLTVAAATGWAGAAGFFSSFFSSFFSTGAGFAGAGAAAAFSLSLNLAGFFSNAFGQFSQQKPTSLPSNVTVFATSTGLPLTGQTVLTGFGAGFSTGFSAGFAGASAGLA